jgi:hypothetical protein
LPARKACVTARAARASLVPRRSNAVALEVISTLPPTRERERVEHRAGERGEAGRLGEAREDRPVEREPIVADDDDVGPALARRDPAQDLGPNVGEGARAGAF